MLREKFKPTADGKMLYSTKHPRLWGVHTGWDWLDNIIDIVSLFFARPKLSKGAIESFKYSKPLPDTLISTHEISAAHLDERRANGEDV